MPSKRDKLRAQQKCEEAGFDPITATIKIVQDERTPVDLKATCLKFLLPYVYPRLSEVELHHEGLPAPQTTSVNFKILMADPKMRAAIEQIQIREAELVRAGKLDVPALIEAVPMEEQ